MHRAGGGNSCFLSIPWIFFGCGHQEECTALAEAEDSAFTVAPTSLSSARTCRSSFGCCRTCAGQTTALTSPTE